MPAYDDELFGPVAAVIPLKDEVEAIATANDSVFGLVSSRAIWRRASESLQS